MILTVAIGIDGHTVIGEVLAQETAGEILIAMRYGQRAVPIAHAGFAVVAQVKAGINAKHYSMMQRCSPA